MWHFSGKHINSIIPSRIAEGTATSWHLVMILSRDTQGCGVNIVLNSRVQSKISNPILNRKNKMINCYWLKCFGAAFYCIFGIVFLNMVEII